MNHQPDSYSPGIMLDGGVAAIAARFGAGAAVALGDDAGGEAADAAGVPRRARRREPVFEFDIPGGLIQGSGTFSSPMAHGPRLGYVWDIVRLTVASFTAGTVSVYNSAAVDSQLIDVFAAAGSHFYGHRQHLIEPNQWLVWVAAGITGNVTITGRAVMVPMSRYDEYVK
jgi:hypothetical protein